MNDGILVIIVLAAALIFLAGAAFLLQKRKTPLLGLGDEQEVFPPPARGSSLWFLRVMVFLLISFTLIALFTKNFAWLWVVFGMLVVRYFLSIIARYLHFFRQGSNGKKQGNDPNQDQDGYTGN